jgi:hypothetical protein
LAARELLADGLHAGDVAEVDGVDGCDAGGHGLLRQSGSGVGRAIDDALAHGRKVVVGHKGSWPC